MTSIRILMREMQRKVMEFCEKYDLGCPVEFRFLDLISELGEMAKEILKATDYGKKEFTFREELKEEIGDVLFSLIVLSNQFGIDLEEALSGVLRKYEKRIKERGTASSGR